MPGPLDTEVRCDVAGQDVGAVRVRYGDEEVSLVDACLMEDRRAGSVPGDDERIDAILEVGSQVLVVFDDDDVLDLGREAFCKIGADCAGSDDHDSHRGPFTPSRIRRRRAVAGIRCACQRWAPQ